MDCVIYEVTKTWTRLSDFHSHFLTVKCWVPLRGEPALSRGQSTEAASARAGLHEKERSVHTRRLALALPVYFMCVSFS